MNYDRTSREARLRIAQDIAEQGTLVETQINNLQTMFSIFLEDTRGMAPAEIRQAQQEMRRQVTEHFLEFERKAWWWFRKVQRDADFPSPLPGEHRTHLDSLSLAGAEDFEGSISSFFGRFLAIQISPWVFGHTRLRGCWNVTLSHGCHRSPSA
jgi:hypothetical protein